MRSSPFLVLLLPVLVATGCAALGSFISPPEVPYQSEPPHAEVVDLDFEVHALETTGDGPIEVDQRWTVIGQDWAVDRRTDDADDSQVRGRFRLIWVGGPEIDEERADDEPRDCYYLLFEGYQDYMGGGDYGPTRYVALPYLPTNIYRMRCETDEEFARAVPKHWR